MTNRWGCIPVLISAAAVFVVLWLIGRAWGWGW